MGFFGAFIKFLIAAVLGAVIAAAVVVLIVMPRMQWNATARLSGAERWIASYVLRRWVRTNAPSEQNPLPASAENLREGEHEYDEHCAVCHGFDGSAKNRVAGDFSPPVARLAAGAKGVSDGQLYFIVNNGIRLSGMPGFGRRHSSDELWKIVLWVRHFPELTPQERGAIEARMESTEPGEAER